MFKLIKINKPQKINRHKLYQEAFDRTLQSYTDNPEQGVKFFVKRLIFYGTKLVIHTDNEIETDIVGNFQFVEIIKGLMMTLTPREFINIFPIKKEYKGAKWGMKDYFYTMDYIKTLPRNEPIGNKIDEFLWEYHNTQICLFVVKMTGLISDLRQLDGQPGLMEEWAAEKGIKIYTTYEDENGKKFLYDPETKKTTRIKTPKPRYLKLV